MTKSKPKQDEKPPAYAEANPTSPQSSTQHPTRAVVLYDGHNTMLPAPTVPQMHICTKHDDINGTFYIDPSASRLCEPPSKAERKLIDGAHASFQSRHGDITLYLGTSGYGAKASAVVATRHGDINVNILPLSPDRPHISLDVSSRNGKVVLFIPETYHGILHLNTKKGELHVLPALSQVVQTFKATSKEALVYVGTRSEEHVGNYCRIFTKHGSIVVGIAGRDQYGRESGLLETLGKAISQLIR